MGANHIQNCLTTTAITNNMPIQLWTSHKPSIHYFRIFGCDAFVFRPKEIRKRFESNNTKCIFVGYSPNVKGYCLYNHNTKKIIIRRDMVFNEQLQSLFS